MVTNGMSYSKETAKTPIPQWWFQLRPRIWPKPLDGIAFQRRLERASYEHGGGGFAAPAQTVGISGRSPVKGIRRRETDLQAGVTPATFRISFRDSLRTESGRPCRLRAADPGIRQEGCGADRSRKQNVLLRADSARRRPAIAGRLRPFSGGEGAGYAGGSSAPRWTACARRKR